MNSYHGEQVDALTLVKTKLDNLPASERLQLDRLIVGYLSFRREVDDFLLKKQAELGASHYRR